MAFSDKDINLFHDEVVDYITVEDKDIPQTVREEASLQENCDDGTKKRIRMNIIEP